jgi:3-oxoacyl-[acyl-carrier protein] reductase
MTTGRVALVSGGGRGIGLATARALQAAGCRVAVTVRTSAPPPVEGIVCVTCDVTDPTSVDRAVGEIEEALGPVEILVANAGATLDKLVLRMSDDDFTSIVDTNLAGAFRLTKRVAPKMVRNRWGRIVLISSVVAATGQAGQANYAASKAGLVGLARSLARELASRNITANVVAPGPVATDMLDALPEATRDAIVAAVPAGRVATPDEIAAAVAFLASDAAAFITGIVLPVDGGLGMGAF